MRAYVQTYILTFFPQTTFSYIQVQNKPVMRYACGSQGQSGGRNWRVGRLSHQGGGPPGVYGGGIDADAREQVETAARVAEEVLRGQEKGPRWRGATSRVKGQRARVCVCVCIMSRTGVAVVR